MSNAPKAAPSDSEPKTVARPNLRYHHRVSIQLAAQIESEDALPGDGVLECELANLSRAGAMANCNPDMIKTLLPRGAVLGPKQAVRVKIRFELPVISVQKVLIEAQCDLVYLRRASRNTFHLGMSFISFENNGQDYIDQYIDRQLQRPG